MTVTEICERLKTEIDTLQSRLVVDDEAMKHLYEIYYIAFSGWYDPDNETHEKIARKIWPHISALNHKFHFKR